MLSGAKHLQFLHEGNEMQILRSAQDDRRRTFPQPVKPVLRLEEEPGVVD